jgi:hypothetical protein
MKIYLEKGIKNTTEGLTVKLASEEMLWCVEGVGGHRVFKETFFSFPSLLDGVSCRKLNYFGLSDPAIRSCNLTWV